MYDLRDAPSRSGTEVRSGRSGHVMCDVCACTCMYEHHILFVELKACHALVVVIVLRN